jgi:hypothetical protein
MKKKRLAFAKKYKDWTPEQWSRVISPMRARSGASGRRRRRCAGRWAQIAMTAGTLLKQ